jgi:hypothetical protein
MTTSSSEQAVIVYLDGSSLPKETYEECDLSILQDQLIDVIAANSLGEFDGNEFGPEGTRLYMYGPDAEALFAGIEPVLLAYPLCAGAVVVIRHGTPGAHERHIILPTG